MNDIRVPPHNNEAEISVIGSVFLDSDVMALNGMSTLEPQHFYREGHRIIWSVMQELRRTERPIDLVMVSEGLRQYGKLDEVGGNSYLIGLGDQVPTSAYAEHYARIVLEKAHLRALISHSAGVMRRAYDDNGNLEDLDSYAAAPPQFDYGERDDLVHLDDALSAVLEQAVNGSGPRGFNTGLADLDHHMNGLEPGRLYILAARPAMGKSAMAFQIATYMALQGHRTLGFSLEMPAEEIAARIMASEAKVGLDRLTKARRGETGALNIRDIQRLRDAQDRLRGVPFVILPKPGLRLHEMLDEVREAHEKTPISLFLLDYLQLVQVSSKGGDNATQRVTEVSMALKRLALELDIPVLALSQLNRAVEQRADRRPMLSDLRESGSVEQDADVVMFIYRDEYYNKGTDQQGVAEIIIGKNRNGPTGTVKVQYIGGYVRFQDLVYTA